MTFDAHNSGARSSHYIDAGLYCTTEPDCPRIIIRSHRLHSLHEMQPISTDVARSVVCQYVCLPVRW